MFQLWGGRGEAFPSGSVTALKGKVSWKLGARKYHKVTIYNKPQTRDLLGGKNSGDPSGCLCLGEKNQRTGQSTGFIQGFLGVEEKSFPEWSGIGGIMWSDNYSP